ncbi:MAG: hypothetical protein H7281_09985 [Bacteriovorax sp.]|nr:hypothetical protein [Bacteriovorax sp.]
MKFMLTLFIFSFSNAFAIDVGNGSDGACVDATFFIVPSKRNYQCTTLTINTNLTNFKGSGGSALVIKVQTDVTITALGTIDMRGNNGGNGTTVGIATGGAAGAGGFAGGSSTATDGVDGIGNGVATPATRGLFAPGGAANSIGSGGGGGSYQSVGAVALDGNDGASGIILAGTNGATYGNELNFDTSFLGGSGGAAGGSGFENTGPPQWFGSAGGGGGGAIRIIAGGFIHVDGSIISNGGNGGGDGTQISSGGGGGGSGGAIWLQAAGDIINNGAITAIGGAAGTNTSVGFEGDGGVGGVGRIRLDDADGIINPAGINPPALHNTIFAPTAISSSSALSRQYASAIACGRVSIEHELPFNNIINLIIGMMITSMIYFSLSRKGKI